MNVIGTLLRYLTESSAKNLTWVELVARLEKSKAEVLQIFESAEETPANYNKAKHVIGIERWGQRRLMVALGEPFLPEEYDGYRPAEEDMKLLRKAFEATRNDTIAVAKQIQAEKISPDTKVKHNDMDEITLKGWLHYLDGHAYRESTRMKRKK